MVPSRRSQSAFLFLPFLLPALTNAVALSDFETLPSTVTSQSCITEYRAPISNCQPSDFQNGAQCSPNCVVGLYVKATNIENACANVVTSDSSLLAIAFHGQLAPKLCKNLVDGSTSSVTSSAPASSHSLPSSSSRSSSPSPSTLSTTTSSPSASSSSISTTSSYSSSLPSGSIAEESGPSPTAKFSGTPSFTGSTQSTTAKGRPTSSINGGGSPFEFSGAAPSRASVSLASVVMGIGCGLLLLLR